MPRESGAPGTMGTAEVLTNAGGDGLKSYYRAKIEEYEVAVRDKTQNLRRLEAQRNELNHKGASTLRPRSGQIWRIGTARVAPSSRVRSGDARPFNASVNHTRRMRAPSTDPRRHPSPRDPPRVGPFQLFPIITTYAPSSFRLAVRMLREEIQLLQEPGSYVGEVVKVMGKTKVLVKVRIDPSHRAHPCTRPPRRRVASADPFFIPGPTFARDDVL